jgi:trehalose synthase
MDKRVAHHSSAATSEAAARESVEHATLGAHSLENYEPVIGAEAVRRILMKAELLKGSRVAHISSTFYGGGVA